jgi:HSP20 family molecular chaperone IbpA
MKNTAIERQSEPTHELTNAPAHPHQQQQQTPQRDARTTWFTPLVDIVETGEAFLFQADLPGVKPDDVDIRFANGVLTLQAKVQPRQPQDVRYAWQEYGVGHFHRTFTINTPIDADGIRAELKHGVLNLYVPKAEHARTRKIPIQTS